MRILVATSDAPFVVGGSRVLTDGLVAALSSAGHDVDLLALPFVGQPTTVLQEMAAYRMIDVSRECDRLIAIRPPSHVIPHPNKVIWFIHHLRAYFDLWGTEYGTIMPQSRAGPLRRQIAAADATGLGEARAVFTNSARVSQRVQRYNGVSSTVLYPPIQRPGRFRCDSYGDEILLFARVERAKRQNLAVEAMRYTRTNVRLRIVGRSFSPDYVEELHELVARCELETKVTLELGWATELRKSRLLAHCLAALYIAFDEDSYGYSSVEAHTAAKAVITTTDGGGTAELITDGLNGRIVDPRPECLAEAMDALFDDRRTARRMGEAGRRRLDELGISWAAVVRALTA